MERQEAEPLFARAHDDVWHLGKPAGEKCWLLQCTGRTELLDERDEAHACRPLPAEADGMQAPMELHLCEACLSRLK